MKKSILFITVLAIISSLLLVACGSDSETTTAKAKESSAAPATQALASDTTSKENVTTNAPDTQITPETHKTTDAPATTAAPSDEPTPNTCDPALSYHTEKIKVKTNNKNEDEVFGTDDFDIGEKFMDTAGSNENERYADGNGMIIYYFELSELTEPKLVFNLRQDYKVSVSHDDWEYAEIANFQTWLEEHPEEAPNYPLEDGSYRKGANFINLEIDPYDYGFYDTIYVMIEDATPNDGWGGTVAYFEVMWQTEGEGEEEGIKTDIASKIWREAGKNYDLEEKSYLIGDSPEAEKFIYLFQAQTQGEARSFCDGGNFIIYYFDMRNKIEPKINFTIAQNYIVEICFSEQDVIDKNWTVVENWLDIKDTFEYPEGIEPVFNENGTLTNGVNGHVITIDPYDYDYNGNVFIRIRNSGTEGWGAAIDGLTITEYVLNNN